MHGITITYEYSGMNRQIFDSFQWTKFLIFKIISLDTVMFFKPSRRYNCYGKYPAYVSSYLLNLIRTVYKVEINSKLYPR
jgi:hypothetical protein